MPPLPSHSSLLAGIARLLDTSPDIVLLAFDARRNVVLFNRGAERLLGYPAAEVLDRPLASLLAFGTEWLAGPEGESLAGVAARLESRPGSRSRWACQHKLGHVLGVTVSLQRVCDDEGQAIAMLALMSREAVDDGQPAHTPQALFAQFMGDFPGYAYLKDRDYRFIYVNKQARDDFAANGEWAGKTGFELFPKETAQTFHEGDQRVLEQGEPLQAIEEAEHADGSRHFYLSYKFPVRLPDGGSMLGGISIDITPLKMMELQLAEAKRQAEAAVHAKGMFLANMSHEIRTPLNGILGMLELLGEGAAREQEEGLRIARQSAESLLAVVNDILDFSRIESGRLVLSNQDFELRPLLQGVIDTFGVSASQKGIRLGLALPPDLPGRLHGDAQRFRQVLLNLVSNAVKFTDHGEVVLSAEAGMRDECQWLELQVRDTGIGIPEDAMDQLFQSFSQVPAAASRRLGGSGLGLAISRQLAELMGGQIHVTSDPGRGSIFSVRLPMPPASGPARVTQPVAPGRVVTGLRLLVVDDNAVNRIVASKALQKLGHEVTEAGNGLEALATCTETHFDLVFMDCQMPVMDGLEAVRLLREREQAHSLPRQVVVAMTASALPEEEARCFEAGMDDFMAKPVRLDTLSALLERWAGRREPLARRST